MTAEVDQLDAIIAAAQECAGAYIWVNHVQKLPLPDPQMHAVLEDMKQALEQAGDEICTCAMFGLDFVGSQAWQRFHDLWAKHWAVVEGHN